MKAKILILTLIAPFLTLGSYAQLIRGGELSYTFSGRDSLRIELAIYQECSERQNPKSQSVGLCDVSFPQKLRDVKLSLDSAVIKVHSQEYPALCGGAARPCYQKVFYTGTISIQFEEGDYEIAWSGFRIELPLANTKVEYGDSLVIRLPVDLRRDSPKASSPVIINYPPIFLCMNDELDFSFRTNGEEIDSAVVEWSQADHYRHPADTELPLPAFFSNGLEFIIPPYETVEGLNSGINSFSAVTFSISPKGYFVNRPQPGNYLFSLRVKGMKNGIEQGMRSALWVVEVGY